MHARLLNRVATGSTEPERDQQLDPQRVRSAAFDRSGHSSQEIARLLSRSIKTIETHRFNIRSKLNLKDGADLIRYAAHWISEERLGNL